MKKFLALFLALTLFVSVFTACAGKTDDPEAVQPDDAVTEPLPEEETPAEPEAPEQETGDVTLSAQLTELFTQLVQASPEMDCEALAEELVQSQLLYQLGLMTYNHADAEFMTGFDSDFAPEAFQKATYLGPTDDTVFLAYVFDLNEGTDAEAFAAYLEDHADPAWNGSATAEQVATAVEGSKVFFLMCSEQEQQSTDYNQLLLDRFTEYLSASDDASAESIAAYLCQMDFPLDLSAAPVEGGWLSGLDEFDQFDDGAMFAPMIGSIPFVGYVFVIGQDVDPAEYIATLEAQANPRWNVCTEADCILTQSFQDETRNVVLFVMAPASY